MESMSKSLKYYLSLSYPYLVARQPEGGFFIQFPDLPGCMTEVVKESEIQAAADEIRTLWIETEFELGASIPEPALGTDASGKFIVRLAKSLHRDLKLSAYREGVSLNQYVSCLLAERNISHQVYVELGHMRTDLSVIHDRLPYRIVEKSSRQTEARRPLISESQAPALPMAA